MLDIEVIGIDAVAPGGPSAVELEELCALALSSAGIADGHAAIEFVDHDRIRELNRDHRRIDEPTDVLSFGVDADGTSAGPRELGDIMICPAHTEDVRLAVLDPPKHQEPTEELMQDLVTLVTVFAGRLYGQRATGVRKRVETVRKRM